MYINKLNKTPYDTQYAPDVVSFSYTLFVVGRFFSI